MDIDSEEDLLLALCFAPGVGSDAFRKATAAIKTASLKPRDFFDQDPVLLVGEFGLSHKAAAAITSKTDLFTAVTEYKAKVGTKPVRLLTADSVIFPQRVTEFLPSPPSYLFAYGNLRALNSTTFAVICSRNPSPADLEKVERAAEAGVLASKVLVGGTNTDAYQRASVVPLRWGAPRILVLDRGLFVALGSDLSEEPFRTARLWRYRFDPETDLVLSRNRPFDEYAASNQKYRDELLVALADEINAVALRPGGNMDKLASLAEKQGRPVLRG